MLYQFDWSDMGRTDDPIQLLMQEVVWMSIRDYLNGKATRDELYEWLDDSTSICFIADCLQTPVEQLRKFVEDEMDKCDKQLAAQETLAI